MAIGRFTEKINLEIKKDYCFANSVYGICGPVGHTRGIDHGPEF
jgi:hypothetical protein